MRKSAIIAGIALFVYCLAIGKENKEPQRREVAGNQVYAVAHVMNTDYWQDDCQRNAEKKRWTEEQVRECVGKTKASTIISFFVYLANLDWPDTEPYICDLEGQSFFENDKGEFYRAGEHSVGPDVCKLIKSAYMIVSFPCPDAEFYEDAETVALVVNDIAGVDYRFEYPADYVKRTTCFVTD
jgi:hypothetical protein